LLHVLLDSCIYRSDRKRNRPAFRRLTRLAKASKLQLHVPAYVKGEVVSQQQYDIAENLAKLKTLADAILRTTEEGELTKASRDIEQIANDIGSRADDLLANDFQTWLADVKAIEHAVQPEHAARVTEAYFAGGPPFRAPKNRQDFPDAFIWQTALDLVKEHGELTVVSSDGRLRAAAEEHDHMEGYETLDKFIESSECQDALEELTVDERVTTNLEHAKQLLPKVKDELLHRMGPDLVHELAGKEIRHRSIPEDNNEARILMVDEPQNVALGFENLEYYGDADIGIPFTATVECLLNYRIYKADYYSLDDEKHVSIDDWSDHYFDAEEYYDIRVKGEIDIIIDPELLKEKDLSDEDIQNIIKSSDINIEVNDFGINEPGSD
jgi:PIN domain-containing protein